MEGTLKVIQMIKTILFSLLSCSLLGLSQWQNADPSLLRTQSGMILVPASAGVSESDAAAVLSLLEEEPDPVAHLAFNIAGETGVYGNFSMEELSEVGREYNTDLAGVQAAAVPLFGFIFFKESRKCRETYGDNKCVFEYVKIKTEAVGSANPELVRNVQNVLDKYGYIEVIASQNGD